MKKTYFAALALCLALTLPGCGNAQAAEVAQTSLPAGGLTYPGSGTGQARPETVAATVEGRTLTTGELQAWYWAEVARFRQETQEHAPDFSQPLDAQPCGLDDSVDSWQQYFLNRALENWHGSTALALQAELEGLPTEEAYQPNQEKHAKYLVDIPATRYLYGYSESYRPNSMHQAYLDGIGDMLETLARDKGYSGVEDMAQSAFGTTGDALTAFAEHYNYGYMYFTELGYYIEPTRTEVEAYRRQNGEKYTQTEVCADIRQILLVPEDRLEELTPYEKSQNIQPEVLEYAEILPDGRVLCSENNWAICEAEGWKLLDTWQRGSRATEAAFAELAREHSDDTGTGLDGGAYRRVKKGQLLPALDSWCFEEERKAGDTTVIRTEYGCHVLYFAGYTDMAYIQAEQDLLAEQQQDLVEAARQRYPMEVEHSAITLSGAEGTVSASDLLYPDIAHQRYPEIPLYLQQDYPNTDFGDYDIERHGCGITSFAMLASYMTDEEWTPPELCAMYGRYSSASGTDGMIFINEPSALGFYFKEKTHDVYKAHDYLEAGYTLVSLQHAGYWTSGGHYIVLESIDEDGLIQVRDSNLYNYGKIEAHKEDRHTWGSIRNYGSGYWVFEKKVTAIPACTRCGTAESLTVHDYTCHKCREALVRRNAYLTACH